MLHAHAESTGAPRRCSAVRPLDVGAKKCRSAASGRHLRGSAGIISSWLHQVWREAARSIVEGR